MRQRSKPQLDRDIADALHGAKRTSHAEKQLSSPFHGDNPRRHFFDAFRAMQTAFEQADEVVARVYNAAQRSGGDKKAMAKTKTVTDRFEKALRDYSEEIDELIAQLE